MLILKYSEEQIRTSGKLSTLKSRTYFTGFIQKESTTTGTSAHHQ